MSIKYIIILAFLIFSQYGTSQEFSLDENQIYKNQKGGTISFADFMKLTSGKGAIFKPVFSEDGKVKEIVIELEDIKTTKSALLEVERTKDMIGLPAPNFSVNLDNGTSFDLANNTNKVTVLKFWFAACKPCMEEIPQLNELHEEFKDNANVNFVGLSLDKAHTMQRVKERTKFAYPSAPQSGEIASLFMVPGYPTHVVINKNGIVQSVFQGVNRKIKDKLKIAINKALSNDALGRMPGYPSGSDKEVEINPGTVIKNMDGHRIDFGEFVEKMNSGDYDLLQRVDESGNEFVVLKLVDRD